jgi:branched-chain amino acid transport system ATP-binding protein
LTQTNSVILRLEGVTKSFGGVRAVDGISFDVERGKIYGLIGPNGSGKSTLFNLIAGTLPCSAGMIYFKGKRIDGLPAHEIAKLGLGRTFQTPRLFFRMTVLDNVLVAPNLQRGEKPWVAIFPSKWRNQEFELGRLAKEQLKSLEIEDLYDKLGSEISGGQMKLGQLARALMTNPDTLLLDEPTAGVAPRLARDIFEDIETQRKRKGTTFLIVEHRLEILFDFVDYVFVMSRGKLIAQGTPDEVIIDPVVIDSYLG